MPQCQLCLFEKPLVKAHIVPEAFWRRMRAKNETPIIYSTVEGYTPKRAPIGVYDELLLCAECDRKIGRWDDYAQSVLAQNPKNAEYLMAGEERVAFILKSVDYKTLKLFFISLLWRAGISNQPFFQEVSLGPFQERLRTLILNEDPGDPDEFSVILFMWEGKGNQLVGSPRKRRLEGRLYYDFTFGGYSPTIKVDKQLTPARVKDYILRPNCDLLVFVEKFAGSALVKRAQRALEASRRTLQERKKGRKQSRH
jgi:hypothetical protein